MQVPKVSVIVPIYGVEKYIQRCVDSLFRQTLTDIEYIFVNDCTTDRSIEILRECIKEHPEVSGKVNILEHKINKGLPQARKTGYENSTGKYVTYCDSDDWVEFDMYEKMYNLAVADNSDIVICGYYMSDGISKTKSDVAEAEGLLMGPVWNKLVKREIYENGIVFPKANKAEDGVIMMQLSYYGRKRSYLHEPLYYYFSNPSSICSQNDLNSCISKMKQESENVEIRIDFLRNTGKIEDYKKDILTWKFEARNNLIPCINDSNVFHLWKSTYPEINDEIIKQGDLRQIIKYFLLKFRLHKLINILR